MKARGNEVSLQDYLDQMGQGSPAMHKAAQSEQIDHGKLLKDQSKFRMFKSYNGGSFENLLKKYEQQTENVLHMQKQQQQANQIILGLQKELQFYYQYSNKHPNKGNIVSQEQYQSDQTEILLNKFEIEKQQLINRHEKQVIQYKMKIRELLHQLRQQQKINHMNGSVPQSVSSLMHDSQPSSLQHPSRSIRPAQLLHYTHTVKALREQQTLLKQDLHQLWDTQKTFLKQEVHRFMQQMQVNVNSQNQNVYKMLEEVQKQKRQLFNQLQELKGNIRVICRLRPLGRNESANILQKIKENTLRCLSKKQQEFEFDHVVDSSVDQPEFFQEIQPLIESLVDGFNVTIFAYGPTGSGKTYTMEGPPNSKGVFNRSINELFRLMDSFNSYYRFKVQISMLEIYNEQIKDLLMEKSNNKRLELKLGANGTYVQDLRIVEVESVQEIEYLMHYGTKNRATGTTNLNEHSSRSHMVYTVYLSGESVQLGRSFASKMHLIDLAGSERLSKSGVTGDSQKETISINKSLTSLGDVINSTINKQSHVPFRNSLLTHFLQDSLTGDSKTLMVLNLSPAIEMLEETLSSMKFGQRVRKVEMGKVRKNSNNLPAPANT